MNLLDVALRFPTIVFTIALGIVLVYWLFVVIGALDIDLLGHGGHDVDMDSDWDLGLGNVPLTISISVIVLVAWVGALLGSYYVMGESSVLRWLLLPLALVVALPLAALFVRPLAPVFEIKEGKTHAQYIGSICTVTSNTVDNDFGFADIVDGGSIVQIAVRADPAHKLVRGDKALVIDVDSDRRVFAVEPSPGGV
ncbi:MAG TPA: hypothetical protein VL463_09345 [Kofleriaceae bacterium]|nr:hypothetical protein [Kofleriaceae bacterium]